MSSSRNLYLCDECNDVVSRIIHFADGDDLCHECGYDEIMRPIACDGCGAAHAILHADDSLMVCDSCMD